MRGGASCPFVLMMLLACSASASSGNAATIRFATYNASLNRGAAGALIRDLATPGDRQAQRIAEVIQRVRPDVLLINEFDYDDAQRALQLFRTNYLGRSQSGLEPIRYRDCYSAPVNTGVPSGFDLDNDGRIAGGGDALGFGEFPGQYGMVVCSQFPIERRRARTFRQLLWRDMPGAALPPGWYTTEELALLPLSSKSHWDLPLRVYARRTIHLLVSHPTPPSFDGAEDRNGRRNHDEIRFWADYLTPGGDGYIRDDRGRRGGIERERGVASFMVLGDLNSDPNDGGSFEHAARQLLEHPAINAGTAPASAGAFDAARRQGGANLLHRGDPHLDTADFNDAPNGPGNLRADYVLPSRDLAICGSGVFWPASDDPLFALLNDDTRASSDHHLVWIDVASAGQCSVSSVPTGQ